MIAVLRSPKVASEYFVNSEAPNCPQTYSLVDEEGNDFVAGDFNDKLFSLVDGTIELNQKDFVDDG